MNIDETQLHHWRTELAGQRFEGAYLTRSQTFSVTALVSLVSAAGSQIPDMLPFEIEEIPGTREAQEREQAVASDEEKTATRADGETKEEGVLEGEDKTAQEKHEERQATTKTATKEEKPQSSAQRAQTATAEKEKSSSKSSSSSSSSKSTKK